MNVSKHNLLKKRSKTSIQALKKKKKYYIHK